MLVSAERNSAGDPFKSDRVGSITLWRAEPFTFSRIEVEALFPQIGQILRSRRYAGYQQVLSRSGASYIKQTPLGLVNVV